MRKLSAGPIILILVLSMLTPALATKITRWWHSDFTPEILLSSNHTQNAPLLSGGYLSWLDTRNKYNDPEGRILPRIFMRSLSSGEEKACSTFTRKTISRSMHRSVSVWAEAASTQANDENFDIMSFDFATGVKKPICTERRRQDNPQVSKDWVIWRDWRNCESSSSDSSEFEVFGMNLADGKEFVIKPKDIQGTAELFGDYVVLSTKSSSKQDYDIQLFVCASKRLIPICSATGDQFSPKVIGNTIIWLDCRTCPSFSEAKNTTIYSYSLNTKKEVAISTQANREYGLAAGDRYMAWLYQPKTGITGSIKPQIRGFDTVSSQFFNISTQPGIYRNLSVSGKYCIYEFYNPMSDFGSDIHIFDFTSNRTWVVFKGLGNQRNPRVYGEYAVWEDHGAEGSEHVSIWGTSLANPVMKQEPSCYGYPDGSIWTTNRGDNQRSGLSSSKIKQLKDNPFRIQWIADLGDSIFSSPVFDSKGNAFLGSDSRKIHKINVFDGTIAWEFPTLGRVKASGAIYREKVFFGDDKGVFYCLNAETGQEVWRFQTGGAIMSSPVAFQSDSDHYGCIAFISFDKKLYLINALSKTPAIKWVLDVGGWSLNPLSVDYNPFVRMSEGEPATKVIYATTSNNRLLCVSVSTGKIIAEFNTKSSIETSPVAFGSTVLVSSTDGILSGFDFTGWGRIPFMCHKEETNHPVTSSPIYDPINDLLMFESMQGEIRCVSEKVSWKYSLGDSMKTSPALLLSPNGQSTVLVACSDTGKLALIDTSSGREITKINLNSAITSSPAIFDTGYPAILVGTLDRKLYCISQRPELSD